MSVIEQVQTVIFKILLLPPFNAVHADGHHKLIRWRMVTHAGIDGHTRLITYMKCSTANTAETVYASFIKAVTECGLPQRVRSDQGGENRLIALHMIRYRGDSGMITGSSVHNQRIERLWRDMHRCVTSIFYNAFYYLEHHGLLDPVNEKHLFALHYIYVPRINAALELFATGWNNHGMRTVHGQSPLQQFVAEQARIRAMQDRYHQQLDSVESDEDYGIEEVGLGGCTEPEIGGIAIPPVRFILPDPEANMDSLMRCVDPSGYSDNYGIDLYQRTLQTIARFN